VLLGKGWDLEVEEVDFCDLSGQVERALARGRTDLLAVGGDGTLNAVVQAVMALSAAERGRVRLGFVGVGSSNDFLQPPETDAWVERVQVALSRKTAKVREVNQVTVEAGDLHYLMNSSVGLIARGCHDFTKPPWWLRGLRRVVGHSASVQIHSAFNALTHPGVEARVRGGGRTEEGLYTGLTILRTPAIAAGVSFQTRRCPGDGLFDVLCLSKVSALELPDLLDAFARVGPREGGPVQFFQAREVHLEFPVPTLVEYDGETVWSRFASYQILPDALCFLGRGLD
jgi:diacylglycerol kinase family enzyme